MIRKDQLPDIWGDDLKCTATPHALEVLPGDTPYRLVLFDEAYWLIDEQVLRVDDPALLVRAAFEGFGEKRYFAFCRLTGYRYPAPDCDALSHRTYACPRFPGYTDDDVRAFCRKMIARNGLFSREAKECLESLPETDET